MAGQQAGDAGSRSLWFNPADDGESSRRLLTRERVVSEALALISAKGAQARSMRAIAARLGVVPGALYRHVRGKEPLYDLASTRCSPRSTARQIPARPGPHRSAPSRAGCGRPWRTIPASPPCSRPAIPSAPHRLPLPRHSSRRCARPDCLLNT